MCSNVREPSQQATIVTGGLDGGGIRSEDAIELVRERVTALLEIE